MRGGVHRQDCSPPFAAAMGNISVEVVIESCPCYMVFPGSPVFLT